MDEPENRKLSVTEIGVVISVLTSLAAAIFTGGIVYAQVQRNTGDIAEIKPRVDDVRTRLERIDANVAFLKELARREQEAGGEK